MHKETRKLINKVIGACEEWTCEYSERSSNWSQYQSDCKKTQDGRDEFFQEYGEAGMYSSMLGRLRSILNTEDVNTVDNSANAETNVYTACGNCDNPYRLEGHQYCSHCGITFYASEKGCGNGVTEKERDLLGHIHYTLTNTYSDPNSLQGKECEMIHSLHYHLHLHRAKFSKDEQKLIKDIERVMNTVWDKRFEKINAEKAGE